VAAPGEQFGKRGCADLEVETYAVDADVDG
jgi:hypothetical protein